MSGEMRKAVNQYEMNFKRQLIKEADETQNSAMFEEVLMGLEEGAPKAKTCLCPQCKRTLRAQRCLA